MTFDNGQLLLVLEPFEATIFLLCLHGSGIKYLGFNIPKNALSFLLMLINHWQKMGM